MPCAPTPGRWCAERRPFESAATACPFSRASSADRFRASCRLSWGRSNDGRLSQVKFRACKGQDEFMGTMIFKLPTGLPGDVQEELERASVAGGQDSMPYSTHVLLDDGQLVLSRNVDESGCVVIPWPVNGAGQVMVTSATLMERLTPYQLAVELARGKVNQIRGQTSDWLMGGLLMSDSLAEKIRNATIAFSRAVTHVPDPSAGDEALQA